MLKAVGVALLLRVEHARLLVLGHLLILAVRYVYFYLSAVERVWTRLDEDGPVRRVGVVRDAHDVALERLSHQKKEHPEWNLRKDFPAVLDDIRVLKTFRRSAVNLSMLSNWQNTNSLVLFHEIEGALAGIE